MILPIFIEPKDVLRQECALISDITPEIKQLAADMRETMHNAQGIGLAAPQIGKSLSLIVIEMVDKDDPEYSLPFLALVNPRITWTSSKQTDFMEACLSIPGVEGTIKRPERVRVKALSLEGETVIIEADDLLARVLQHEIDHLHGKLFTDYLNKKQLLPRRLVDYPQV